MPHAAAKLDANPRSAQPQVDVICSGLNTGKTQALIDAYLDPALAGGWRVILVTCRRAFSRDLKRRIDAAELSKDAVLYMDIKKPPESSKGSHGKWGFRHEECRCVVITWDSLHKVLEDWEGWSTAPLLVVLDELSSLTKHLTSSGTLEPTGLHLGMRSVPRNARCVGLWRGVMKASRIVAMDGFVRSVDLAYLAESAQEVGARLGLLHNSRRTCDWKMRVSDSPAHVEADIMALCRPGRCRAMIIAETPAKAIEMQEKIAKQALEQLSLGGAQYVTQLEAGPEDGSGAPFTIGLIVGQAKEKSVRFTNDGPVRIVSIDVSEEGAY
eukprot:tig00000983_g5898.t1